MDRRLQAETGMLEFSISELCSVPGEKVPRYIQWMTGMQ